MYFKDKLAFYFDFEETVPDLNKYVYIFSLFVVSNKIPGSILWS